MNIDTSNAHCGPRILFLDHSWLRVASTSQTARRRRRRRRAGPALGPRRSAQGRRFPKRSNDRQTRRTPASTRALHVPRSRKRPRGGGRGPSCLASASGGRRGSEGADGVGRRDRTPVGGRRARADQDGCRVLETSRRPYDVGPSYASRARARLPCERRFAQTNARPQSRGDYPPNLSILLSGGKETNKDSPSSGERTGTSPAPNPAPREGRREMWCSGGSAIPRSNGASKSFLNGATYPQRVPGP